MDFSNNKVINILDTDAWSDALLIKDEAGNLGRLKSAPKEDIPKIFSKIDHVSEGNLAPQDDNFMIPQNIMGHAQDKAEFVFHPDDKAELDFFAKNMPTDDSKKYSIEKIVDRIIAKQELNLDDKNKKIFSNILYNFFRNRKSTIITRELLTNNVLIKNKKLASDIIDTILSIIKSIKNKIDFEGGLVVNQVELKIKQDTPSIKESQDKILSAQDEIKEALGGLIAPKLAPIAIKSKLVEEPIIKVKFLEPIKPAIAKPAAGFAIPAINNDISKKEAIPVENYKDQTLVKDVIKDELKITTALPKVLRSGINQTPKKSISDVVTPVKEVSKSVEPLTAKSILTGAIQELQSIDLVGFRRLGNTANESIQKILDKINLLEQESYTKKAQGILAWRNSEIYQLYLKVGVESMVAGKEVADFIAEATNKDQNTFTVDEFSAISDLNKQLRF